MTNRTILPSQNTAYGFYGTVTTCPLRDCNSDTLWTLASTLVAEAINAQGEAEMIGIRDFLDSKMGRHFADEVIDALRSGEANTKAALDTTVTFGCLGVMFVSPCRWPRDGAAFYHRKPGRAGLLKA